MSEIDSGMNSNLSAPTKDEIKRSDQITGGYLLFVSIRCTLQYVILPFVLPFFGLSTSLSIILSLVIDVVALAAIAYNLKRLWSTSWRWRYLALCAVMIPILIIFLVGEIRFLMGA